MGWTFSRSWRTRKDLVAFLRSRMRWGEGYQLQAATTRGNHHWYLMKHPSGVVFIGLDLLQGGGRNMGWGYKDLDETVGPTALDCPLSYLHKASPPQGPYAAEWRNEVAAWHAQQAKRPAPKAGLRITLGGAGFILLNPAGKGRGWIVRREVDAELFRVNAKMLNHALLRLVTKTQTEKEAADEHSV